jgi:hypothetical protein
VDVKTPAGVLDPDSSIISHVSLGEDLTVVVESYEIEEGPARGDRATRVVAYDSDANQLAILATMRDVTPEAGAAVFNQAVATALRMFGDTHVTTTRRDESWEAELKRAADVDRAWTPVLVPLGRAGSTKVSWNKLTGQVKPLPGGFQFRRFNANTQTQVCAGVLSAYEATERA